MARIRSIKPEFWTSEQIVECSPNARLLFVGMWCFADDAGIHPASTKRLKMEVFPADSFLDSDVQGLIGELEHAGLIETYEAGDALYWRITGWSRHQKIDRPTFRYPPPEAGKIVEPSASPRLHIADGSASPRDGVESNGVEGKGYLPLSVDSGCAQPSADHLPACPHQQIIGLYAKHLPDLPRPRAWEGQRANNLKARWRWVLTAKKPGGERYAANPDEALTFFERFFGYVAASDFLTGRDGKWQGCDLAWLVKSENFSKVIEGIPNRWILLAPGLALNARSLIVEHSPRPTLSRQKRPHAAPNGPRSYSPINQPTKMPPRPRKVAPRGRLFPRRTPFR